MQTQTKNAISPQISIVTVGMNHLNFLKAFFRSLFIENVPTTSFELIYVDNCSSDGTVEFIKESYPQIRVVVNKTPLGFGENNNIGSSFATGRYIAIINPDIVLLKGSLDNLYHYAEQIKEKAIIVPQLLNPDLSLQYSVRGFMTPWIFAIRFLTKGQDNFRSKTVENYLCKNINANEVQFVNWAMGAAMFMSKDLFDQLEGFDTDYFMYVEDEDLCLRSWKMNYSVIYNPNSQMIHNHLRGSSKIGKKTVMHFKSILLFFRKHGVKFKNYSSRKLSNTLQE